MRYRLRTLLILLAILPPLLAVGWWLYSAWQAEQASRKALATYIRNARTRALTINWAPATTILPSPVPRFRKPPGEIDYQFPPQPPLRISDELPSQRGRDPVWLYPPPIDQP